MEQHNTAGNFLPTFGFCFLGEAFLSYKCCELNNVFRQKYRVMNKFFVTLVAEHYRLTFDATLTGKKNPLGLCAATVG
ncbi:MAG: hypothetical protein QG584_2643 [Pseudomonadota bacterium]|nr:hypothetical protein [Pseudomonadota bacterium]